MYKWAYKENLESNEKNISWRKNESPCGYTLFAIYNCWQNSVVIISRSDDLFIQPYFWLPKQKQLTSTFKFVSMFMVRFDYK